MRTATFIGACVATCVVCARASAQEAPATPQAPAPPPAVQVHPYASIVGGAKLDTIIQSHDEQREGRISAIALADFGVRGQIADWLWFDSELMANGGTGLHGASAWEGQAALQVRQQVLRFAHGPFVGEAGRIIDEGSVDFFSAHVADTFLQDTATRDPLLFSGFNLGNGLRGTYEPLPGLRLGLAFTAGNPVSNSASLQVGGSFPPFDRFYIQPYQQVKQSPNNYPDDTFHMMMLSPQVLFAGDVVEARAEFQGYVIDTNTNRTDDDNIRGYNVRANVKLKLADDLVAPFANFSFGRNDTVQPTDVSKVAPDKYTGITYGAGVDVNYAHLAPDRPNGVGVQYERVQYQVGSGNVTNLHYLNLGTTYWLARQVAVGARFALWLRNDVGVHDEGERSLLLTVRTVF